MLSFLHFLYSLSILQIRHIDFQATDDEETTSEFMKHERYVAVCSLLTWLLQLELNPKFFSKFDSPQHIFQSFMPGFTLSMANSHIHWFTKFHWIPFHYIQFFLPFLSHFVMSVSLNLDCWSLSQLTFCIWHPQEQRYRNGTPHNICASVNSMSKHSSGCNTEIVQPL